MHRARCERARSTRCEPDGVASAPALSPSSALLCPILFCSVLFFLFRSVLSCVSRHKVSSLLIESKESNIPHRDAAKKAWFNHLIDRGYHSFEFYEEVGRSVWSWDLHEHLFPIQVLHRPKQLAAHSPHPPT